MPPVARRESRVPITTYLPPDTAAALCARAVADDRSIAATVRRGIHLVLNESNPAGQPGSNEISGAGAAGDVLPA